MDKLKGDKNAQKKKFVPTKIPRFLPGSVDLTEIYKDLEVYNQHRYNLFTAVTKIDTRPPRFHALKYLKASKMTGDRLRMRQLDAQNKTMLKRINIINRTKGCIDSFNPYAYALLSNWRLKELDLRRIDKENKILYKRLINTKSQYPKEEHDMFFKKMSRKMEHFQKYPHYKIMTKDDELREQPSITAGLALQPGKPQPKRPRVFLEFQIADCQIALGRIVIELYADYAPRTAENFLAICREKDGMSYRGCPVQSIFKDRFLVTGDVTNGEQFDEESTPLKHTKAGVLSMLSFAGKSNSQFCITFDALPAFDGRQPVFGKVTHGADTLFKINDFGRKFGKPVMRVSVSRCGVVSRKRDA